MRQRPNTVCSKCRSVGRWANNTCPACYIAPPTKQPAYRAQRYGSAHKSLRSQWAKLIDAGYVPLCARCSKPITSEDDWALDHLPTGESKPSCRSCNGTYSHLDGNRR